MMQHHLWHDLNTSLAGIKAALIVVLADRASAEEAHQLLGLALESTERLEQMLEGLRLAAVDLGVDARLQAACEARGAARPEEDDAG